MSQSQASIGQQSRPTRGGSEAAARDTSRPKQDEWTEIKDPGERRKIQNKLAQRRFREFPDPICIGGRDKQREQKEETEREMENQRRAGGSYASPEPGDIDPGQELSGLPWGGISMRHIVEAGKNKEQNSQQSSRENSVHAASRNGGSSRLGLRLTDQFARGYPAWRWFPYRAYRHPGWSTR
ncbi:hypothetical protein BU24DRAFT_492222 [Aaosphaeria arxii CBS 175.79]|uniref:BZIP domain-containing protein n=1 Tax=Aaosphaeria arxii CBS 175.79 TaxID=1450172 RepID=A0A6A5XT22_9PLEO|nr:uncharacterized protein BU24DRAFT_492222 [Aaosphaeria arxii CBS 175.79]KAF2016059.1 hypothetical protein BU24DRAFT_492222 [Aaosphaeria arxii CBS 175.79]